MIEDHPDWLYDDHPGFRSIDKRFSALRRPVASPIPYPGLYGPIETSRTRWRVVRRPIQPAKYDAIMIGNLWMAFFGVMHGGMTVPVGVVSQLGLTFLLAVGARGGWLVLFPK